MSSVISSTRVRRWNYRASNPSPPFSRELWDQVRSLGFLNYWTTAPPPPPVTHAYRAFCEEAGGIPTEGRLELDLPLSLPALEVGISFQDKAIRDTSALRFHLTNGQTVMVNLVDFAEVENGASFSCSLVFGYTDLDTRFCELNVILLSNPNPTSRLVFVPVADTDVPFIDAFTVLCNDLQSVTAFNWCYSAFT
jgi:hypothetical protein